MNIAIKVLLCLWVIPVFVSADTGSLGDDSNSVYDRTGDTNTQLNPIRDASDSTFIGSSGSGSTSGTADSDNLYIFYQIYEAKKLLYKITGFLTLLVIIGCMILYSIYKTSMAINNDEKFKSDQKSFMLVCMIAIVFFSIYVCVR